MICTNNKYRSPGRRRHRGFSFTEILFAVMILGIGFIMVAAIFPVAIKQTQESAEETTAADAAKGAASYLQQIATSVNFAPTGGAVVQWGLPPNPNGPLQNPFWQWTNGNLISTTDSRYAWVPFYSRYQLTTTDAKGNVVVLYTAPYAQVTIIAVAVRNASNFSSADVSNTIASNLVGRSQMVKFTSNPGVQPDTITFSPSAPGAAEGAYVIVGDDSALPNVKANAALSADGYVYRLGGNVSGDTWELMPGSDTKAATKLHPAPVGGPPPGATGAAVTSPSPVQVYIVGRGYTDPTSNSGNVSGPAMDIAAYSTFIQVYPNPFQTQ